LPALLGVAAVEAKTERILRSVLGNEVQALNMKHLIRKHLEDYDFDDVAKEVMTDILERASIDVNIKL
jgi:hypothetical protein